jgi:hypothetical protein
MKLVLSGTNLPELHAFESNLVQKLPPEVEIIDLNLQKQSREAVEEILGAVGFFAHPRYYRVTKWESLRSPKQKQEFVALFTAQDDQVTFVIPQELTAAQKKWFGKEFQVKEFKLPKVFFQFTESIKTKPLATCLEYLHKALEQKNEWELHSLLARQIRLVLASKTGATVQAPPFALRQLQQQAAQFSEHQLVFFLHELFRIEWEQKSSKAHQTWSQEIDRLLVRLYDEGAI